MLAPSTHSLFSPSHSIAILSVTNSLYTPQSVPYPKQLHFSKQFERPYNLFWETPLISFASELLCMRPWRKGKNGVQPTRYKSDPDLHSPERWQENQVKRFHYSWGIGICGHGPSQQAAACSSQDSLAQPHRVGGYSNGTLLLHQFILKRHRKVISALHDIWHNGGEI